MADVDEIIDYIKSLKKGFDKALFQSKIEELAYAVDTNGLNYDDFHTLFKVWLNLSITKTKWASLGACLVPPDVVEQRTIEYAFRWLLANYENQSNSPKVGFLLDWLTAAMDCDCIDMSALDDGYELFYTMFTFEVLTTHAMKLVYTLTKPVDVTRRKVLELLTYAKNREGKKNWCRQLQVVLGLFKSYKPECVPEDIPAISIHTAFKKINVDLLARFKRNQEHRNSFNKERQQLLWINPLNSERSRNKKVEPLVPNMEFVNVGSKQYGDKEPQKNCLDFSDAVNLVQYSLQHRMTRPARLRAMLCNTTGLTMLAAGTDDEHAFLSHDLQHLLTYCFLDGSPHSYTEKADFLRRLAILQRTLLQGLPVITRFLAQYLPFWNEKDYFAEILELVEWVSVDSPEQVSCIIEPFARMYQRAQPLQQCALLGALANVYANMVFASSRSRHHFMSTRPVEENYATVLPNVANTISDMCSKALQVDPTDIRAAYSWARGSERMAACSCRRLPLALALLTPSAALLDKMAGLMLLYKNIFSKMKAKNMIQQHEVEQIEALKNYTSDLISCLYFEVPLSTRKNGIVFEKLHPQLVGKLTSLIPDIETKLSISNHIAFAPYTYLQLQAIDYKDADNKLWFDTVIEPEFENLSKFMKKAVTHLR